MRFRFDLILLLMVISAQVLGEEYSWVESDELKMELNARRDDLERTQNRVEELQQQLSAQQHEILNLKQEMKTVDARLVQRTSMLYRLSKNGKSVQYLFLSDSMISFVKRMQTLRLLVTSQMDEKRDISLQLARLEDEKKRTQSDLQGATQLSSQLGEVVEKLQTELSGRRRK
ncbi:MAG: hypothetical protein JXR76_04135 [Deltaproteobacteria bacterium]|nr:hypothetical protein [Deltaproteobacteria bacterium]